MSKVLVIRYPDENWFSFFRKSLCFGYHSPGKLHQQGPSAPFSSPGSPVATFARKISEPKRLRWRVCARLLCRRHRELACACSDLRYLSVAQEATGATLFFALTPPQPQEQSYFLDYTFHLNVAPFARVLARAGNEAPNDKED